MNLEINEDVFRQFPYLETTRLKLRSIGITDAPSLLALRSDERVMKYMDSKPFADIKQSEDRILSNIRAFEDKKGIEWVIENKKSADFMGTIGFWRIDKSNNRAEIGYSLGHNYWGKGFMQEALINIIYWGFNNLKLHSIEANINPSNKRSKTVLEKLGFKREAYFRENFFYDGKFLDSEIFSLLETDQLINR